MSLVISGSNTDFKPAPAGTHIARCVSMVDLGMQEVIYSGQISVKRQVYLGFELSNEFMEDGRPFFIGRRYTASLNNKAALRKDLEAWRGRRFNDEDLQGFNITAVVGHPCMVTVSHTEKEDRTYANIAGVSAIPKGFSAPEQVNESLVYDLDEPNPAVFEKLPDWIKECLKKQVDPNAMPESELPPASAYENELFDENEAPF